MRSLDLLIKLLTWGKRFFKSILTRYWLSESSHGLKQGLDETSARKSTASSKADWVASKVYPIISRSEEQVKVAPICCKFRVMANWLLLHVLKPAAILIRWVAPKLSGVSKREPALKENLSNRCIIQINKIWLPEEYANTGNLCFRFCTRHQYIVWQSYSFNIIFFQASNRNTLCLAGKSSNLDNNSWGLCNF